MSSFRPLLLALACTVTLAGCQSSRVVTDYDQSVDFTRYQQYSWLDERSGASDQFDPLLAKRVRDAISSELQARGFSENAAGADFLVRFFVASSAAVSEPKMRGGVGMGSFGGSVGMGVSLGFPLGGTRVKQEAEVLIDFLDPQSRELTWRGREPVTLNDDPEETTKRIRAAVARIVAQFPPKAS